MERGLLDGLRDPHLFVGVEKVFESVGFNLAGDWVDIVRE